MEFFTKTLFIQMLMIINTYLIFIPVFEKLHIVTTFSVIYIKLYDYLDTTEIKNNNYVLQNYLYENLGLITCNLIGNLSYIDQLLTMRGINTDKSLKS
jgi:hypothetical protein